MAFSLSKRTVGGIAGAAALVALSFGAAIAADGDFVVELEIVSPLTVTTDQDMSFDTINSGTIESEITTAGGGGCVVNTVGAGAATVVDAAACAPAAFTLTAPVGTVSLDVTVPETLTDIGGEAGLDLEFAGDATVAIDGVGNGVYALDGTLTIPAGAAYDGGDIPVTVEFTLP